MVKDKWWGRVRKGEKRKPESRELDKTAKI